VVKTRKTMHGRRWAPGSLQKLVDLFNTFRFSFSKAFEPGSGSLSNHIRTSLVAHPHLVQPPSVYIDPRTRAKSLLSRLFVVGIGDGQSTIEDEMCCESIVGMRRIVSVAARGVLAWA
jgi:hypothetical protein